MHNGGMQAKTPQRGSAHAVSLLLFVQPKMIPWCHPNQRVQDWQCRHRLDPPSMVMEYVTCLTASKSSTGREATATNPLSRNATAGGCRAFGR